LYVSSKRNSKTKRSSSFTNTELLNKVFVEVIDSCIKKDNLRIFYQKVTKKIAPDYFEIIKNPIDLTLMKNKAKRGDYKN
jgi:histone acetyltransferase